MSRPVQYFRQLSHIKEFSKSFQNLQGGNIDIEQYWADYFTKYESFNALYLGVCEDLQIEPRENCLFEE